MVSIIFCVLCHDRENRTGYTKAGRAAAYYAAVLANTTTGTKYYLSPSKIPSTAILFCHVNIPSAI